MRILVTGGAGFIGSHLANRLINDGHVLTILDNLSEQIHGSISETSYSTGKNITTRVRFIKGSVCDKTLWNQCLLNQDIVVHLAAETGTGQSMYEIAKYIDTNIVGISLMLDWLSQNQHEVRRVIIASSRAVYGEGKYLDDDGMTVYPRARKFEDLKSKNFDILCPKTKRPLNQVPTDEDSRIQPSSVYGITKYSQEQLIMTVCPSLGIEPVALRYQNVYGPGQSLKNPYTGILSIFSTRALNRNPIEVFEDGKESRDFIFIDDVIDATVSAIFKIKAAGQIFNIGSGVATDVLTVAKTLVDRLNSKTPVVITGSFRLGDIRHNIADISKAHQILEFKPKINFQDGISRFTQWVLSQKIPLDNYEYSIQKMKDKGLFH